MTSTIFWVVMEAHGHGQFRMRRRLILFMYLILCFQNPSISLDGFTQTQRLAGLGASGLGFTTVTLFLYVLLMPWVTGEEPNVSYPITVYSPAFTRIASTKRGGILGSYHQ